MDKKVKNASICVDILHNERYIKNIDATDAKQKMKKGNAKKCDKIKENKQIKILIEVYKFG